MNSSASATHACNLWRHRKNTYQPLCWVSPVTYYLAWIFRNTVTLSLILLSATHNPQASGSSTTIFFKKHDANKSLVQSSHRFMNNPGFSKSALQASLCLFYGKYSICDGTGKGCSAEISSKPVSTEFWMNQWHCQLSKYAADNSN
jgi:hypothetical protein